MQRVGLKQFVVALAIFALIAAYGLYWYRERRMDRLYEEAAGIPRETQGSAAAQAAVRELGKYRSAKSTQMLLNIAMGRVAFPWPDVQREAINALASRNDPSIGAALASTLQPHNPLPTRQAAADALRALPCNEECVRSVLHYLERVWYGELNYEERVVLSPGVRESADANLAREQEALYQTLYEVLKRQAGLTLNTLVKVYGLGTCGPSKFSLALLSRMQFRQACPALLQSEKLVKLGTDEVLVAPREELETTLRSLKCQ